MRRAVGSIVGIAAATILVLSGCATSRPAPAPTSSPAPQPAAVLTTGPLARVDPAQVPALRVVALARSGEQGFSGQIAYIDGDSAFNTAVDATVLHYVASRAPAGAATYQAALGADAIRLVSQPDPAAAGPRLGFAVVAATGTIVGMQLLARDSASGPDRVLTTLFTDFATGQTSDGSGLVDPASASAVNALLPAPVASPAPPAPSPTPDAFGDATIDSAGRLVIPSSDGSAGGQAVAIRAAIATPLLTPFGREVQAAMVKRTAPSSWAPVASGYRHVPCAIVACVALTYDDGPGVDTTQEILADLKAQNAVGTFFEIGGDVAAHPDITSAVVAGGNVVGNHTWDHPNLTTLSPDADRDEIERTDAAIRATGSPLPSIMRAPYGATNDAVRAAVGKPLIHWSVDSFDWQSKNPAVFVPLVERKIRPGGIVLMHDIYQTTAEGQKPLMDKLRGEGYTFVTVPQLFDGIPLVPGQLYACRGAYTPDTGVPCVSGP